MRPPPPIRGPAMVLLSLFTLTLACSSTFAAILWTPNGVPLCAAPGEQSAPAIAADGFGGFIAAWVDRREPGRIAVYVGGIASAGIQRPGWPVDGFPLTSTVGEQRSPQIVSDHAGGALIGWLDVRDASWGAYVQHVLPNGTIDPAWPADGLRISPTGVQTFLDIDSDAAGGIVLLWVDDRPGLPTELRVSRLGSDGQFVAPWTSQGTLVLHRYSPNLNITIMQLVGDSEGGAFAAWKLYDPPCQGHGCGQGFYGSNVVHVRNGVVNGSAPSDSDYLGPWLIPDPGGGALAIRAVGGTNAFMMRHTPGGPASWATPFGIVEPFSLAGFTGDMHGGAYMLHFRPEERLALQHLGSAGLLDPVWPEGGVFPEGMTWYANGLVPDAEGSCFILLSMGRSPDQIFVLHHVRIDGSPGSLSQPGGLPICEAPGDQSAGSLVADGHNGVLVTWTDTRSGGTDLYAQRVGPEPAVPALLTLNEAEWTGSAVRIRWIDVEAATSRWTVERAIEEGPWEALGAPLLLGVSNLEYEDHGVEPGRVHRYRLVRSGESGVEVAGEASVFVPAAERLDLVDGRGAVVQGSSRIRISSVRGGNWQLELRDVRGRLIWENSGQIGPSTTETLQPDAYASLAPGLYWWSLALDGGSEVQRMVFVR